MSGKAIRPAYKYLRGKYDECLVYNRPILDLTYVQGTTSRAPGTSTVTVDNVVCGNMTRQVRWPVIRRMLFVLSAVIFTDVHQISAPLLSK